MVTRKTGRPPGQPATPTERKRRLGQLPAQANVVVLPPARTDVPDELGDEGTEMWRYVTQHGAPWLAQSDMPLVRLLCAAVDRRSALLAEITSTGPVLYTDKGYAYANPAVGMLTQVEHQMTTWLSQLGFTPTDRARLGLAEVKTQSKLEELRARRTP